MLLGGSSAESSEGSPTQASSVLSMLLPDLLFHVKQLFPVICTTTSGHSARLVPLAFAPKRRREGQVQGLDSLSRTTSLVQQLFASIC